MQWILASASPRRRDILDQVGAIYQVAPSNIEERSQETSAPEMVKDLAMQKARDAARNGRITEETLILAADTVVSCNGKILGKPKSKEEAFSMLSMLSGQGHEVYTGVALLATDSVGNVKKQAGYAVETKVFVRRMTPYQIEDYIATGETEDKAGAYGIQGAFARYIERIEGDYYNVVGLPVSQICQTLEEMELDSGALFKRGGKNVG